ncbi:MAG: ATP-binding protein [Chloroflexi bacterium]|nr:ATP-binding protein [Chloroflexota bacterium]MCI0647938.1 ATP-binding protein [Chloroflexota bacterium]MCI0726448.1 ATP-binding protein [Chloroflexota bacterium]
MTSPIEKLVVSPILVGRTGQLAALNRLRELAHDGQGQVALLLGEAGIGKTRLVAETKQAANY